MNQNPKIHKCKLKIKTEKNIGKSSNRQTTKENMCITTKNSNRKTNIKNI